MVGCSSKPDLQLEEEIDEAQDPPDDIEEPAADDTPALPLHQSFHALRVVGPMMGVS